MSAVPSASLYMTLLSVLLSVSAGQTIIRAVPGQTVSLPCKALNNDPVIVVDWRRTDMKEDEYVLLYRDDQLDPENQHQSYQNRVDLQDRQMKDGDVSLSLNNVKTEDSGTYECSVETKTNRRKRDAGPTVIKLNVVPEKKTKPAEPGQTVSLPCKALNNETVLDVEWRRTDLKEDEYVLLYRDDQLDTTHQHPSYKNRVDLQDRQMKDGDVSLSLNNVKIEDRGTYECYIKQREKNIIKKYVDPISIIRLEVVPPGQTNITAEAGQNVSLPCKALNNDPVIVVEWRRTDMKEEYVLLYRDNQLDPENQHPSYKNRVDLQDRQMKDGDVSLSLKNLKIEDRGIYECSVKTKTSRRKRDAGPTVIKLNVVPGHTDERKGDGGDNGPSRGPVGLIVAGVLVLGVVGFLISKIRKH